jgi:hypothetical protein
MNTFIILFEKYGAGMVVLIVALYLVLKSKWSIEYDPNDKNKN